MPSSLLRRRAKDQRAWLLSTPREGAMLKPVNLLVKLGQATQNPPQSQL